MQEIIKLLIGCIFLVLGVLLGNWLASNTKEELKKNQKWFKLITILGLILGFVGLWINNDVVIFSFFFIAVVTSRSLKKKK